MSQYTYPEDRTGVLSSNLITKEQHSLTSDNSRNYHFVIPKFAPFYGDSIKVFKVTNQTLLPLEKDKDYHLSLQFTSASISTGKPVYGAISFVNLNLDGDIEIEYQTVGGKWTLATTEMVEAIANIVYNPRGLTWDQITNKQENFGPTDHTFDFNNLLTEKQLGDKIEGIRNAILETGKKKTNHEDRRDNPHGVTATQLGLGSLEGKSLATIDEAILGEDENKLISVKVLKTLFEYLGLIDLSETIINFNKHIKNTDNPHEIVKEDLNLGLVENLSVATREEILGKQKVRKLVTLESMIDYLRIHGCQVADDARKYPKKDSLLNEYCKVRDRMGIYADGYGGTYEKIIEVNSVQCGYQPPAAKPQYPVKGTLLSRWCIEYEQHGLYADGYGGTYSNIINQLSPACGYKGGDAPRHPDAGTVLGQYCDGTTQVVTKANGTGGSYEDRTPNSPACKSAVTHPPQGTLIEVYCSGTTQMGKYADGNGGQYNAVVQANSAACGYQSPAPSPSTPVPPPPAPNPPAPPPPTNPPSGSTPSPAPLPPGNHPPRLSAETLPNNIYHNHPRPQTTRINLWHYPPNQTYDVVAYGKTPHFNGGAPFKIIDSTENPGRFSKVTTNASGHGNWSFTIEANEGPTAWELFGIPETINPVEITYWFEVNGIKSNEYKVRYHKPTQPSGPRTVTGSTNRSFIRNGDYETITVRVSGFKPNTRYNVLGYISTPHFRGGAEVKVIDVDENPSRFSYLTTDSAGNGTWTFTQGGGSNDIWSVLGIPHSVSPLEFKNWIIVDGVKSNVYTRTFIR